MRDHITMDDLPTYQQSENEYRHVNSDDASVQTPSLHNDKVSRLRRFLTFCLAIDYSIPHATPEKLTREELHDFLSLARHCFDIKTTYLRIHPLIGSQRAVLNYLEPTDNIRTWRPSTAARPRSAVGPSPSTWHAISDPRVMRDILEPAKQLGVPCSIVISMLRLFIASIAFFSRGGENGQPNISFHRGYRTQLLWLATDTSLGNLAAKFLLDRTVLLDAVVLCPEFRRFLRARMTVIQGKWLRRVESPTDFEVAEGKGAYPAASGIDYREKRWGKRYSEAYKRGWYYEGREERMLDIRRDCRRAGWVERSLTDREDWMTKVWRWHFKPSRLCLGERWA